jgi:transcriptional regulator NrdR family protein
VGFLEVLKRSGAREKYSRAKLLRSLIFTTDHLNEPETAFALADTIETRLLAALRPDREVFNTQMISDTTLLVLKRYDASAYVKYLSYQTNKLDARDLRQKLARN